MPFGLTTRWMLVALAGAGDRRAGAKDDEDERRAGRSGMREGLILMSALGGGADEIAGDRTADVEIFARRGDDLAGGDRLDAGCGQSWTSATRRGRWPAPAPKMRASDAWLSCA